MFFNLSALPFVEQHIVSAAIKPCLRHCLLVKFILYANYSIIALKVIYLQLIVYCFIQYFCLTTEMGKILKLVCVYDIRV